MRIATWNVNSIRARLPRVLAWLEQRAPDVACLQETKCLDEQFPRDELAALGYHAEFHGQKTYNGVAILSRAPLHDVQRGFAGDPAPEQCRVIGARVGDVELLNVYVVNGQQVGHPRYAFKLEWLARLAEHVRRRYDMGRKVVVTGDFNCTFDDRDVYDPDLWRERILCSTPEREALARLMEPGLVDALRKFHEEPGIYTWWDFRIRGFARNRGLRIDHFLMSPPALDACRDVEVDVAERAAPKPSDHAPVVATLAP